MKMETYSYEYIPILQEDLEFVLNRKLPNNYKFVCITKRTTTKDMDNLKRLTVYIKCKYNSKEIEICH